MLYDSRSKSYNSVQASNLCRSTHGWMSDDNTQTQMFSRLYAVNRSIGRSLYCI